MIIDFYIVDYVSSLYNNIIVSSLLIVVSFVASGLSVKNQKNYIFVLINSEFIIYDRNITINKINIHNINISTLIVIKYKNLLQIIKSLRLKILFFFNIKIMA